MKMSEEMVKDVPQSKSKVKLASSSPSGMLGMKTLSIKPIRMKQMHVKLLINVSAAVVIFSGLLLFATGLAFYSQQSEGLADSSLVYSNMTILTNYHQDFHCEEWERLRNLGYCNRKSPKHPRFSHWDYLSESVCLKYSLAPLYTVITLWGIILPVILQILIAIWSSSPTFFMIRDPECTLSIWISRAFEGFLHVNGIHLLAVYVIYGYHKEELAWLDQMAEHIHEQSAMQRANVNLHCHQKTMNFLVILQFINIGILTLQILIVFLAGLLVEQDGGHSLLRNSDTDTDNDNDHLHEKVKNDQSQGRRMSAMTAEWNGQDFRPDHGQGHLMTILEGQGEGQESGFVKRRSSQSPRNGSMSESPEYYSEQDPDGDKDKDERRKSSISGTSNATLDFGVLQSSFAPRKPATTSNNPNPSDKRMSDKQGKQGSRSNSVKGSSAVGKLGKAGLLGRI